VLESVAGVPGMVGGTLRHLRSLRLLVSSIRLPFVVLADDLAPRWGLDPYVIGRSRERADAPFVSILLTRHDLKLSFRTFLTVAQPTWLTRFLVLGAQGVMYNLFFLTYLISSKTAHRFVGALEEEACRT
jgi:ubiquinol oxidase